MNEQNNEIEKLEEQIAELRGEEHKYAQESGEDVHQVGNLVATACVAAAPQLSPHSATPHPAQATHLGAGGEAGSDERGCTKVRGQVPGCATHGAGRRAAAVSAQRLLTCTCQINALKVGIQSIFNKLECNARCEPPCPCAAVGRLTWHCACCPAPCPRCFLARQSRMPT